VNVQDRRAEALRLRDELHASPKYVAQRLGVSTTTVYRWFNPESAARNRVTSQRAKARRKGTCSQCGRPTSYDNKRGICTRCYALGTRKWTREAVISAIQIWAEEHGGRPPVATDWNHGHDDRRFPSLSSVYRSAGNHYAPFASWAAAIEAAGFPRPLTGVRTPEGQARMILANLDWTPSRVERELLELSENGIAPSSDKQRSLYRAARHYWGTWEAACRRVGLEPRKESSDLDHAEIRRLREEGKSYREIARTVGCSYAWARVVCQKGTP